MNQSARSAASESFPETPRNGRADLALLLILALAAVLRSIHLGALDYWIDEDLTWLAVRGIQEHGVPLLPSGVVYDRALPYSYLVAFASLSGATPEGLRLPSLISSLGTIVFLYLLARDLAGRTAGFLTALLLAVSPWEHHYARMARMYAPFVLLVSASLFFALRSLATGSRAAWLAACVLVLIAVPLHDLGSTLILIFLVPMLYPAPRRPPLRWTAGGAVAVILGIAVERIATSIPPMQDRVDLQLVLDIGTEATRITLPLLPEITLNHARWILFDLWNASPLAASTGILGLVAAAMGVVGFLRRTRSSSRSRIERVALGGMGLLILFALMFNQLVLAGFFALALLTLLGPDALPVRRSILSLGLIVTAAASALLLGQAIAHGTAAVAERSFLRLFFSIPVPFYRLMVEQHPISVMILVLGSALLFPRFLRGDDPRVITLFGFLLASLLLMGLFRSPYVIHRYTYYLNPAFVTLLVICAREIGLAVARMAGPGYRRIVALGVGIGLVLATEQFDPGQSWAASHRGYGYERDLLSDPDLVSHFYADYGSCARFVLADRRPGDIAIAKEPVEIYPYGLRCDLRVNALYGVYALAPSATQSRRDDPAGNSDSATRSTNSAAEPTKSDTGWTDSDVASTVSGAESDSSERVPVDWYLGIPILSGRLELEAAINRANAGGHSVYIIYTRPDPSGPAVHLPEDVLEFLAENDDRIVHTGGDGLTVVLRFRPS